MKVTTTAVMLENQWYAFECNICGGLCLVEDLDIARGISRMHMALCHGIHQPS